MLGGQGVMVELVQGNLVVEVLHNLDFGQLLLGHRLDLELVVVGLGLVVELELVVEGVVGLRLQQVVEQRVWLLVVEVLDGQRGLGQGQVQRQVCLILHWHCKMMVKQNSQHFVDDHRKESLG